MSDETEGLEAAQDETPAEGPAEEGQGEQSAPEIATYQKRLSDTQAALHSSLERQRQLEAELEGNRASAGRPTAPPTASADALDPVAARAEFYRTQGWGESESRDLAQRDLGQLLPLVDQLVQMRVGPMMQREAEMSYDQQARAAVQATGLSGVEVGEVIGEIRAAVQEQEWAQLPPERRQRFAEDAVLRTIWKRGQQKQAQARGRVAAAPEPSVPPNVLVPQATGGEPPSDMAADLVSAFQSAGVAPAAAKARAAELMKKPPRDL